MVDLSLKQLFTDAIEKLRLLLKGDRSSDYSQTLLSIAEREFKENPSLTEHLVNHNVSDASPEQLLVLRQAAQVAQQNGQTLISPDKIEQVDNSLKRAITAITDSIPSEAVPAQEAAGATSELTAEKKEEITLATSQTPESPSSPE